MARRRKAQFTIWARNTLADGTDNRWVEDVLHHREQAIIQAAHLALEKGWNVWVTDNGDRRICAFEGNNGNHAKHIVDKYGGEQ